MLEEEVVSTVLRFTATPAAQPLSRGALREPTPQRGLVKCPKLSSNLFHQDLNT